MKEEMRWKFLVTAAMAVWHEPDLTSVWFYNTTLSFNVCTLFCLPPLLALVLLLSPFPPSLSLFAPPSSLLPFLCPWRVAVPLITVKVQRQTSDTSMVHPGNRQQHTHKNAGVVHVDYTLILHVEHTRQFVLDVAFSWIISIYREVYPTPLNAPASTATNQLCNKGSKLLTLGCLFV